MRSKPMTEKPVIRLISITGRYDDPIYPPPRPAPTVADVLHHRYTQPTLRPSALALLRKS